MDTAITSLGLRLEDSEALIQALDDHMKTCELAKKLAMERDELRIQLASLRLLYADVALAQRDHMCVDLIVAGWEEVRVTVWRSPQKKIYRGCAPAWHAMRGLDLGALVSGN
jgi:hypothetical protein